MQAPSPLLDRRTLDYLERLALRWQRSFSGLLGGHNVSRYAGVGHEFLDHRNFQEGDDLRAVNWRAYLRLERLFLKMFRTEPRTPVRLFIDTSESMACGAPPGGPGEPKFTYACRLAAALCYVGLVRLETIVLQPFGESLGESYRAQGGRHRFAQASRFLSGLETGGPSNLLACARQFITNTPAPGLAIVFSDFLDESGCGKALQYFADFGHELLLIHLAGPEDVEPSWKGELELVDAESGDTMRMLLNEQAIAEYKSTYESFCHEIETLALRNRGRYVHLVTDLSLQSALHGSIISSGALTVQ